MNPRARLLLVGLLVLFVLLRLPGVGMPYQQDEFKSVVAAESGLQGASNFHSHPPLTAILLTADATIVGGIYGTSGTYGMRLMPLLFGLLSAIFLFAVVRRRFDERAAFASLFFYSIAFYGIWASLMIDTDGAILPALFLAVVYSYDRAREALGKHRWLWWGAVVGALLLGLLVKLSFVLVMGALMLDFAWEHRREITRERVWYALGAVCGFGLLVAGAFFVLNFVDPAFSFANMIAHARGYLHLAGRNYIQIVVEGIKAIFYLSPLLLAPLLFLTRETLERLRIFVIYLGLGLLFYFVLFDFSRGALDKYLMFSIVPLAALSGAVLSRISLLDLRPLWMYGAVLVAGLLIALNFLPHAIMSLYPKTAWFGRVVEGAWNVLIPFNGGSGPVGFYVSFLFIAACFAVTLGAVLLAYFRPAFRSRAVLLIVAVGCAYNAVFLEEFAWGKLNGSASSALREALSFISSRQEINEVITYNDIGAYELYKMRKYAGRFYAAPQFETEHRDKFSAFSGEYLVVGIPPLYEGFYRGYFKGCTIFFTTRSKNIEGTVYGACAPTKK